MKKDRTQLIAKRIAIGIVIASAIVGFVSVSIWLDDRFVTRNTCLHDIAELYCANNNCSISTYNLHGPPPTTIKIINPNKSTYDFGFTDEELKRCGV